MKVVLATCRSKPALTASDALLAEALERAGVTVGAAPWDAIDPEAEEGAVCLRSTWDYHLRWSEFREWTHRFTRDSRLWNPAESVLWNADKRYLRDLAAAGVALPRTAWFEPGERPDVAALLAGWGVDRAVLKPRVSATAFGTHVVTPGKEVGDGDWAPLERSGCLVQSFVPEIESGGEVSLVYLDGRFSHAVLKRPKAGDFRVQKDFGGSLGPTTATEELVAFGGGVLDAAARPWIYARVDLVRTDAEPVLMELELIEPDLFLTPPAAERLAAALIERVARQTA